MIHGITDSNKTFPVPRTSIMTWDIPLGVPPLM